MQGLGGWEILQGEARDCPAHLGEELKGGLSKPVAAAGHGRVDVKTRAVGPSREKSSNS